MITVSAVVVAFGPSEYLPRCIESVLASRDVDVEVILVDNGGTGDVVDQVAERPGVTVVRPGHNSGFAEGCNVGATTSRGDVIALVNPDVEVQPDCLARLAAVANRRDVGIATASLRTAQSPSTINSAGNPVHYLGVAWAGAHGEPAAAFASPGQVASASGALCAIRRALWEQLGGFEPMYFAYHEDVELSLRCWLDGSPVIFVPDAIGVHHYEFGRNALKLQLLERNRWLTLLTLYSGRMLLVLAPALVTFELLMLLTATVQGWLPAKVAGYRWLLGHGGQIRERRRVVQQQRRCGDRELADVLTARLAPTNLDRPPGLGILNGVLSLYWSCARRCL